MARFALLALVALAAVAISQAAPQKKGFQLPPMTVRKLTPMERKKHPNFHASHRHRAAATLLPDKFDARTRWPQCKSISTIRNQGLCGTCWAVSSASVISDRLCIASGQKAQDFISSVQIASCYRPSQGGMDNCDAGGDAANAYKYATIYGVASGGEFNSKQGCQPYPVSPSQKIPLTCAKSCTNGGFSKSLTQDGHFVDSYWTTYVDNPTPQQIKDNVVQMKTDLVTNGPITAAMTVYSDFQDWDPKSSGGEPYKGPSYDAQEKGGHAIRIIGWGVSQRGTPYWMIANSWGTDVGDQGVFWLEMGKNVVGIEDTISAPIVSLPNNCGSLCDAPLDQLIKTKPSDPNSPVFAFQGNCSAQVKFDSTGKMSLVGAAGPMGKQFVGAPTGPIVKWMDDEEGKVWLMNPTGKAGACGPAQGSTKQTCTQGTAQTSSGPVALTGYDKYIFYNESPKNQYMFRFPGGSSSGSGAPIGNTITSKFSKVNSLTDIDGRSMMVCGTDTSGAGLCGVMSYNGYKWAPGSPGPLKNFLKC